MGYPSAACLTCKKRRVKCDSKQPSCDRCSRADRRCLRLASGEGFDSVFKNENAFARGEPRRRRKVSLAGDQNHQSIAVPTTLRTPVETVALSFWMQNWTDKPSDIPDIGREYLTFIPSCLACSRVGSILQVAVSAQALVVFGRLKNAPEAIAEADKYYTQVIRKARSGIQNMANVDIDEIVLATMLMTHYESATYQHPDQTIRLPSEPPANQTGDHFWKHVCHYLGTAGLLKVRQQPQCPQSLSLYRAVRRPMVRAAILRGMTVQEWLRDAAVYGEEGSALSLDAIMVRVAHLRHNALQMRYNAESDSSLDGEAVLQLYVDAKELNSALSSWPKTATEDYEFSTLTHNTPDLIDSTLSGGKAHTYRSFSHAAMWNRFHAVSMTVNSIIVKMITACPRVMAVLPQIAEQLQTSLAEIGRSSTEIRRSIPYFFGFQQPTHDNIMPKVATTMAWPLAIAIGVESCPDKDVQYFRIILQQVALVLGDGVLENIAAGDSLRF